MRGRWPLLRAVSVALLACACRAPTGAGSDSNVSVQPPHRHALYRLQIEPMAAAAPLPRVVRAYVHVAAVTAMRCPGGAGAGGGAQGAMLTPRRPASAGTAWHDALIASAWAGHGASGAPPFQLRARRIVALHERTSEFLGDGEGDDGALCQLHLLFGRADDAPEPSVPVPMARTALHLDLALATGARTIRTDVAWGHVLTFPATAANGLAIFDIRLDVGAALSRVAAELDLGAAAERDIGRAMLRALAEGAGVAFGDGAGESKSAPGD